jgi:hypothetical protein
MSFNGSEVKSTVVHTYYGILFSNEKEQTLPTDSNMDGTQEELCCMKKEI